MNTVIISDIHLGSPYCRVHALLKFLKKLPPDVELVFNGDVVDHWNDKLEGPHQEVIDHLVAESQRRKIVWVRGNHDRRLHLQDWGRIQIEQDSYSIGKQLYVSHGHHFDYVMPYNKEFIRLFRAYHKWRIRMGAPSIHVASYAKKFPRLYKFLTTRVKKQAVRFAKARGYPAVTCGHTHFIEDTTLDGIRYLNTGSWTESPSMCVRVRDTTIDLVDAELAFA